MRTEEKREPVARVLTPPVDEPIDELPLVGRVRRRVPHHHHDRPGRVEIQRAQKLVVFRPRTLAVKDVCLRPARHDDAPFVDVVIADEVVAHHDVLNEIPLQPGRDNALADRVVPARDVSDHRQSEPTPTDDERHDGMHLHVGQR